MAQNEKVSMDDLLKRIAKLEDENLEFQVQREKDASMLAAAELEKAELQRKIETGGFAPMLGRNVMEEDIGERETSIRVFDHKTRAYKNETRMVRFFRHLIDLAPSGGTEIKINGVALFHGNVYELDIDTLRTVKEIEHRSWQHEEQIQGSQESKFRKPVNPHLSMKSGGRTR